MLRNLIIISLLWAVFILILSGLPGDSLPSNKFDWFPHFDKAVHAGLYFPLAFFLMAEFSYRSEKLIVHGAWILTLSIVGVYGGLIELAQDYLFVNRSADWIDLVADLVGGVLGILAYWIIGKPFFQLFTRRKNS